MSCCGQKRAAMAGERIAVVEGRESVWVSYAGARAIVVKGPMTGYTYRFAPGSVLQVNAQDAPSMRGIPGLRERD